MKIQDSLLTIMTSFGKTQGKGTPLSFFYVMQYHIMCILFDVPTQIVRPMFHKHVLKFEKMKKVLEGFTISHGMAHPQQVKHNIKLNLFFKLFVISSKAN